MCFVWFWEQTAIISLYNINWLVFITKIQCLLHGTDWIIEMFEVYRGPYKGLIIAIHQSWQYKRMFAYDCRNNGYVIWELGVRVPWCGHYVTRVMLFVCYLRTLNLTWEGGDCKRTIGSGLEVRNDLITHATLRCHCGDALTAALGVTGRQFVLDASEIGRSSYS